jgi:PPIC-type PPIASE domain
MKLCQSLVRSSILPAALLALLILPSLAFAQAPAQKPAPQNPPTATPSPAPGSPSAPGAAPQAAPPETQLPPNEPVITIHNVCSTDKLAEKPSMRAHTTPASSSANSSKSGAKPEAKEDSKSENCTKVMTREEFEKMLESFHPQGPVPAGAKQNLARAYVEWEVMENAALKDKLQDDPDFEETMRVLRLRVLADLYRRHLDDQLRHAPDSDLQAYYQAHIAKFEEVHVHRIVIPKVNPSAPKDETYTSKTEGVANEIHDRLVKGDDPDTVLKDAYAKLGITSPTVNTDLGVRRRGALGAQADTVVFALKSGEVSPVQTEPAGLVIYKVDSKETLPLDKVKDEVSRDYAKETLDAKMKEISDSADPDYNTKYFGPMVPPAPAPGAPSAIPPRHP